MGVLYDQLAEKLCLGMSIPDPLRLLYAWIESRGTFVDQKDGIRIGLLFSEAEQKAGWTDSERPGGTSIQFSAIGNTWLEYWFGHKDATVLDRLCVFAK